jgi:hypothetical protein
MALPQSYIPVLQSATDVVALRQVLYPWASFINKVGLQTGAVALRCLPIIVRYKLVDGYAVARDVDGEIADGARKDRLNLGVDAVDCRGTECLIGKLVGRFDINITFVVVDIE